MTFDEYNLGVKIKVHRVTGLTVDPVHAPPIDQTIIAPLTSREALDRELPNGSAVWTPEVQALETFRQSRLCKPPYKRPGWRPPNHDDTHPS